MGWLRIALLALVLVPSDVPALDQRAADPMSVDLALVLAIDVSRSVNMERFMLQRDGYAGAFRDAAVIDAIRGGEHHAIAVTIVEWSGADQQRQVIPWSVITDRASSEHFAAAVSEADRVFDGSTSISGGLGFSAPLFATSGFAATRRIIDVSGDGSNNSGRPVTAVRDAVVAQGITINGLPILTLESTLDTYYQDNVIGGPGAFVEVAENYDSFPKAVLAKLIKEIATTSPARPHAAGRSPKSTIISWAGRSLASPNGGSCLSVATPVTG
jgi:hypothetical protein